MGAWTSQPRLLRAVLPTRNRKEPEFGYEKAEKKPEEKTDDKKAGDGKAEGDKPADKPTDQAKEKPTK